MQMWLTEWNPLDGVMRLNECEQVQRDLSEALGINLTVVDASQQFLEGLKGIEDPEVCLFLSSFGLSISKSANIHGRKSESSSVCRGV